MSAFDIGPGNIWIDEATQRFTKNKNSYDRGGKIAAQGTVDEKAIEKLLKNPFINKKPPKSTGRDDFPFSLFLKHTKSRGKNQVATATEFTARSICKTLKKINKPHKNTIHTVIVCGGGAKNTYLMKRLSALSENVSIQPIEKYQFNSQLIEAQAFALLGYLSLKGVALGGPWTGVASFAPPGWITPGQNWGHLLTKLTHS